MRIWVFLASIMALTSPAAAMSVEDCTARAGELDRLGMELKIVWSPRLTSDGWCRIDGAAIPVLDGTEILMTSTGADLAVQLRHSDLDVPEFGPFRMSAALTPTSETTAQFRISLSRKDGDNAVLVANLTDLVAASTAIGRYAIVTLDSGQVAITGKQGLVGEALAAIFDLDRDAASSLPEADRQRTKMKTEIAKIDADPASKRAFETMIRAYPSTRGTARLELSEGAAIPILPLLIKAMVDGDKNADAVEDALLKAGLTFRWER